MRKINLFIAGCTLSLLSINPSGIKAQIPIQYPEYTFEKEFDVLDATSGDCRSHWDEVARASAQDNNNNDYYFTGGYLKSGSGCLSMGQGLLMKTNERGEQQWAKSIPSTGYFNDIKCVYDDNTFFTGLVAAGSTYNSTGGIGHYEVVRTDVNGNLLYHKQYVTYGAVCNKVQQVVNLSGNVEGFITVGTVFGTNDHIYIARLEDDLDVMWDKEIYLPNVDSYGYSVMQTADKGFLITGTLGGSIWVIKLDYAGIMSWKKAYSISGNSLSGKDAVEVMNGVNSEYYILGNTTDASSDFVVLKIDANGVRINDSKINLGAQELASGLVFVTGGYLTISGTSNGFPVLFKVDSGLSTFSFSKKYVNTQHASPVIKANDAGYVLCGHNYQGPLCIIKTLDDGISECNENDLLPTGTLANLSSTSTLADSLLRGVSSNLYNLGTINLAENTICANYCRAVITSYTQTTINACYQLPEQITVNYVPGVSVEWYESTNLNNIIYTGTIFTVSLSANTSYVVRSYSSDGCLLSEVTFNVIVSPAPVAYQPTYITACYGQNIHLQSPCGLMESTHWTNPNLPGSDIDIVATQNDLFTVECYDLYGCLISTHEIGLTVTPPVVYAPIYIWKCVGEYIDLSAYGCLWTDDNNNPVQGPFTLPQGTHHFSGTCQDFIGGCIYYRDIYIHVNYCLPDEGGGGGIGKMANASTENVAAHTVGLYPNPATNAVQVSVNLGKDETFSLQVVDMLGKTLINLQNINDGELSLDIAALPAGVYHLEISVGSEVIRKKLVKQ